MIFIPKADQELNSNLSGERNECTSEYMRTQNSNDKFEKQLLKCEGYNQNQEELLAKLNNLTPSLLKKNWFGKKTGLGIYIYGTVGTGKTMIMDHFYHNLEPKILKQRIHFAEFMLQIHRSLFELNSNSYQKDPIVRIAKDLAKKYQIICLDELEINDIADAMIVGRLFEKLFNYGMNLVITSNRAPDSLYLNGLQREYFLKSIEIIKLKLDVIELKSPYDYRTQNNDIGAKKFFFPLNSQSREAIWKIITSMTLGKAPETRLLEVNGKNITLNSCYSSVLVIEFNDLCNKPLGNADYMEICKHFNVIFIINIPRLLPENRNEAKRLTLVIDMLYERNISLYCLADSNIDQIYEKGDGAFEFRRTVSRMHQMSE